MTMLKASHWAIALIVAGSAFGAVAQTYQWKDASGRTIVSDTPPPSAARVLRSSGASANTTENSGPAPAAKTLADKEQDFRKRQQEAREKADKDRKEQAAARDREENCRLARQNLGALESQQPIATFDENGQRQLMDSDRRQQELERTRRVVSESCR
jgi:hypothetical protein